MKTLKKQFQFTFILFISINSLLPVTECFAQYHNVGIGTINPSPSALLDIDAGPAGNQGVLVPRLTAVQRLAIPSPANSLLVFDTDTACFFYWNSVSLSWKSLCRAGANGLAGSTGATGSTGNAGANGATGSAGANGLAGSAGAAGAPGSAGATGATGSAGATGFTGNAGADLGTHWTITGNANTVDGTNFIGTTDNTPFNIRVNNRNAGRIDPLLRNSFFGLNAGNNNTSGYNNIAIGDSALFSTTTGYRNTANGAYALFSNTLGTSNNATGYAALYLNTIGIENNAIGRGALYNNTTAGQNIAIGSYALYSQSYNNFGSAWSSDNLAIGYKALYYNDPSWTLDAIENVAVGNYALHNNSTGYQNTAIGVNTLDVNTTGSENTALGYGAGGMGATHNQCTFIGAGTALSTARTNVTALGYNIVNAQCTDDNQVLLGNTAVTKIRTNGTITSYSDARFKVNIKDNVSGLDFILKLKPVTYNVRPRELHKIWGTPDSLVNKMNFSEAEKETRIGFLAQDVEKAAKESGFNFPGIDVPRNDKEVYALRYVDFIMPMVKSIQELSAKIDLQQKLIETQQKLIEEMQKKDSAERK